MKRADAARLLNEVLEEEEDLWTEGELEGFAALGFNELGGGIGNRGLFVIRNEEEARRFVEDAPVSRSLIWLE
jgi:hypothetical protein